MGHKLSLVEFYKLIKGRCVMRKLWILGYYKFYWNNNNNDVKIKQGAPGGYQKTMAMVETLRPKLQVPFPFPKY